MTYSNETRSQGGIWIGGILAGMIAGIVMAMFSMIYAGMKGMGFTMPVRLIAGTLYGADALTGGMGVLLTGLMIHMVVSAMFGLVFAALIGRRRSGGTAAGWGLLYGVMIWAVMSYFVVPMTNPTMGAHIPMMARAFFFEHLLFGMTLGITPGLVRRFSKPAVPIPIQRAA